MQLAIVIITVEGGKLTVFLSRTHLPADTVNREQSLDEQAQSIFLRTIGESAASGYFFEQLYTFSFPGEHERPLLISYYFLLPSEHISGIRSQFTSIASLPVNHPDGEIVRYAVKRLRWKIEYTNVVYSLLRDQFTLGELQKTYEAILGKPLDKRNFRKKILTLKLVKPIGKTRKNTVGRGAQLYAFRSRTPVRVRVF